MYYISYIKGIQRFFEKRRDERNTSRMAGGKLDRKRDLFIFLIFSPTGSSLFNSHSLLFIFEITFNIFIFLFIYLFTHEYMMLYVFNIKLFNKGI